MKRTLKADLLQFVQDLPEDGLDEDLHYPLYLRTKIERGLEDIEAGRVVAHAQVKHRLAERWAAR